MVNVPCLGTGTAVVKTVALATKLVQTCIWIRLNLIAIVLSLKPMVSEVYSKLELLGDSMAIFSMFHITLA